ncbi:MAG: fused MFS/spermidine synthase, partial [Polyangiaceae bacterium]
ANLYNREFYETAARRLTEGGVLSQWIQLHHTTLTEVASQLTTARAVFAHAALFLRGQGVLVMSNSPLQARPGADLADLVLADETIDQFVDDVCRRQGVSRQSLISTDDNLRLEYATPRDNVAADADAAGVERALMDHRRPEVAARLRAR